MLVHGGRITWDEMALIAVLVLPLVILIALVLRRGLRGTPAPRSSQDDERRSRGQR
jgi:hypothetical protein